MVDRNVVYRRGTTPLSVPYSVYRAERGKEGRMLREPEREEIDPDLNEQLIVEYYSR